METVKGKMISMLVMSICFVLLIPLNALGQGKIMPEKQGPEAKIIYIQSMGDPSAGIGNIVPSIARIKPGTTAIWVNQAETPIEIQFSGKQVTAACKSPVHFVVDEKGSFISNRIALGAVASLCFVEKGEFDYVVRRINPMIGPDYQPSPKEIKGKITVE